MKIRNIIAVIVGVIVSVIIIIIGEALVHIMNPQIDIKDPEAFKAFISNAPVSLHIMILLIYALACFLGALISASIAIDKKMSKAMSLGGLIMGIGMFSLVSVSHPMWVVIVSVFIFLPFAYWGGMLSLKMSGKKKKENNSHK